MVVVMRRFSEKSRVSEVTEFSRHMMHDILTCTLCGENDATAYWDCSQPTSGSNYSLRVCPSCAVEKLSLLIADSLCGHITGNLSSRPLAFNLTAQIERQIPSILASFWRGVAFQVWYASQPRPQDTDDPSDPISYLNKMDAIPPDVYKGVKIIWDEDRDERIYCFIDEMGGRFRRRLISAGEHEGSLELRWNGAVPRGYRVGNQVDVGDDTWQITVSEKIND